MRSPPFLSTFLCTYHGTDQVTLDGMAPIQSLPIDQVWAESLVGLRLKVPGSWWHGEPRKRHLFACKVAKVDFTKENRKYFQIDVLEESGVLWPMRYDAVAGYVDTEHDTFKNFQLPPGRKIRSDAIGQVSVGVRPAEQSTTAMSNLRKKQKTHHWRIHQSVACAKRGRCAYNGCPNLTISQAKEKRSYDTYMRCEQCTLEHDKSMYFCNDTKKGKPVLCHMLYHQQYCKKNEDY